VQDDHRREDEWFRENEKQLLEAARVARARREQERADKEAASDRKRLREMHYMKCPKCGHDLKEQDLAGVKIDRCTHCEGVFFDAGELDQIFAKKAEERRGFFRRLAGI
jgi:ribosomal protein L37AE/L43A